MVRLIKIAPDSDYDKARRWVGNNITYPYGEVPPDDVLNTDIAQHIDSWALFPDDVKNEITDTVRDEATRTEIDRRRREIRTREREIEQMEQEIETEEQEIKQMEDQIKTAPVREEGRTFTDKVKDTLGRVKDALMFWK